MIQQNNKVNVDESWEHKKICLVRSHTRDNTTLSEHKGTRVDLETAAFPVSQPKKAANWVRCEDRESPELLDKWNPVDEQFHARLFYFRPKFRLIASEMFVFRGNTFVSGSSLILESCLIKYLQSVINCLFVQSDKRAKFLRWKKKSLLGLNEFSITQKRGSRCSSLNMSVALMFLRNRNKGCRKCLITNNNYHAPNADRKRNILIHSCLDYILRNFPRANKHIQILLKEYWRRSKRKQRTDICK